MPRGDKPTTPALALKDGWIYEDTLPPSITKEQYDWWHKESLVLDGVRMGPPLTTLEPGAGGHVHRFNAVRVPPEFGHSYLRCAYCGLSKHLTGHDASTCELCARISPASTAPVVDNEAQFDAWWDEYQRPWLPNGVGGYEHAKAAWKAALASSSAAATAAYQVEPVSRDLLSAFKELIKWHHMAAKHGGSADECEWAVCVGYKQIAEDCDAAPVEQSERQQVADSKRFTKPC